MPQIFNLEKWFLFPKRYEMIKTKTNQFLKNQIKEFNITVTLFKVEQYFFTLSRNIFRPFNVLISHKNLSAMKNKIYFIFQHARRKKFKSFMPITGEPMTSIRFCSFCVKHFYFRFWVSCDLTSSCVDIFFNLFNVFRFMFLMFSHVKTSQRQTIPLNFSKT